MMAKMPTVQEALDRFIEYKSGRSVVYPGGGLSGEHYDNDVFVLADAYVICRETFQDVAKKLTHYTRVMQAILDQL